ncbi:MAG TPA: PEGA domain-containing protein [Candidatus Eisenbacteria bacterium]|nr:PEGA domain-containing protein [Candidatus Eisenbacteria bacterium]
MRRQLLISFFILLFLGVGTLIAIFYGKGYRLDFTPGKGILKGTGLLVTTSVPDGAQVFINDHLTTATNNTINLPPGQYKVRIFKDGYFPWEKTIDVEKEVVSKAEATLFPTTPKLESITETGALSPTIDPSFTKIAYVVASQSARKNGIYVLDMGNRSLLTLSSNATQVADGTVVSFDNATLSWSPDGKQILASIPTTNPNRPTLYLLDATTFTSTPKDVTETIDATTTTWSTLLTQKQNAQLNTLKPTLKAFAMSNMTILSWSPDETKFIYTASNAATLQQIINPKIIGADSMTEERNLSKGSMYVYDIKEDKNFLLLKADQIPSQKAMWFPDSKHIVVVHDKRVDIREYDGANNTTLFAGPFVDSYAFPWPTGEQIVVLTNLGNPDILPNLYTISLK